MNVPKYYLKRKFLLSSVVFNTLFSIGFLAIYQPFSATFWLSFQNTRIALYTLAFYAACFGFQIISKEIFRRFEGMGKTTSSSLPLWLAGEFVIIALIYLAFTSFLGYSSHSTPLELVIRTVSCVGLILIIPFLLTFMYANLMETREENAMLKSGMKEPKTSSSENLLNFYDHSGVLKISAHTGDIFFIESQDNYVNIHYLAGNKTACYLLRASTIEVEKILKGTSIVRCHRSFLVNLDQVKVFEHSTGKARVILSDPEGSAVPVSRTYYKELLEALNPELVVRRT